MSEHVPVAQPAGGLAAWRRSLRWWDWYFVAVFAATVAVVGDWRATAVLGAMALWYLALGRRVLRVERARRSLLYLGVAAVLLAVAVWFDGSASFILAALAGQAHMSLSYWRGFTANAGLNLVPVAVAVAVGRPVLAALSVAVIVTGLTAIVAFSIERLIDQGDELARSRAEVARLSREAERHRLGADLHDTIAQGLSSVVMLVQAAEATLDRDRDETRRHLELAARTARENLRELRSVLDGLMPAQEGLPQALRRLATRFAEETGVRASVAVTGESRSLPIAAEVVLLRAAQESLSNVRRHANAGSVTICLGFGAHDVHLDVSDDGQGFEPDKTVGGHGLQAMRSRVTEAGGSVEVRPSHAGTSVRVAVPA